MTVTPVSSPITLATVAPATSPASDVSGFASLLGSAIANVESAQTSADQLASNLLVGGQGDVHSVALASQKAELSMELFQQIRNKFVQAYQEVMKMPM